MANPEHLAVLRQGVEVWNKWRLMNDGLLPDLSDIQLSWINLREANLIGANFSRTDLSGTDLSRADLNFANLVGVDLQGAKLKWANLSDANLSDANLNEANLSNADLRGASLHKASLRKAILRNANLAGSYFFGTDSRDDDIAMANIVLTNLSDADLSSADLGLADLTDASLSGANLTDVDLSGVKFNRTDLSGANFDNSIFMGTVISNTDLSVAAGLDCVRHRGPSSIAIDTFLLSKGRIPESFIQGVGVPDIFIQYAAALVGAAFEYYSTFVSYSSKDEALAQRLYADLQAHGVRCWFAPEDLKIGDKFRTEIDRAIRVHDKLLLLLSVNSVLSDWVEKEVESAFERERRDKRAVLFPIRLDDAVMQAEEGWPADIRRTRHIGDFTNWKNHDAYLKAFNRLMRDLKAAKTPGASSNQP